MSEQTKYTYDVFISYSRADRAWVHDELLPRLKNAGLKVLVDEQDFEIGVPKLVNIERAVDRSQHTLVVLTPDWLKSEWSEFEGLLAGTADAAGRKRRLLPLILQPCQPPAHIAMLTPADFADPATWDEQMSRLLRGLGTRARVFISYKRGVEPDEPLTMRLCVAFESAGHSVFIDQEIPVGVEWAMEIQRQIEACDFMIVLLSEASVHSEMVAQEVESAFKHCQQTGKSRLLPVRVNYADPLPYQLSHYLDQLQYAEWHSDDDDEGLIRQLLDAISDFNPLPSSGTKPSLFTAKAPFAVAPRPYADPRFIESLREPSGPVGLRSEFYIERESDAHLRRELGKPFGTTTTIRAPRQTGKSSLLIRGVAQAQSQGSRVAFIDLQPVEDRFLQSLDDFLQYFTAAIVTKLGLDRAEVEKAWRSSLGAPDKTTYLMEEYVLPQDDTKVILAVDEADCLLKTTFHDTFFGLIRFWHNNRAMNDLWENLDIVMVISTEPHLLISDVTRSPFNVGEKIRLNDFDATQVEELNRRYRSPLEEREIPALVDFLSGHPYLTHKALYVMLTREMTWEQLTQVASTEKSPFGDHLRRYLWLLKDQPELRQALKRIISHGRCPDQISYYRLLQAGLIKGPERGSCVCRCKLYQVYLKDRL